MSLRQQIIQAIQIAIQEIRDPKPVLVTSEPFEVDKIAITQFPAVLIQLTTEQRDTVTMGMQGAGRRTGTMTYEIRGFVRGTSLDAQRTNLITAIENALDLDRYFGLKASGVLDSQIKLIEIIPRLAPLAEFRLEFVVNYNYLRGSQ
jgi:hypothetical protein